MPLIGTSPVEQHSDTAQCCLFIEEGVVVGKDVGFD